VVVAAEAPGACAAGGSLATSGFCSGVPIGVAGPMGSAGMRRADEVFSGVRDSSLRVVSYITATAASATIASRIAQRDHAMPRVDCDTGITPIARAEAASGVVSSAGACCASGSAATIASASSCISRA
jgi:hypothetical protein